MRAREHNFHIGRLVGGVVLFPYQLAFGFSFGVVPCYDGRIARLYVGPLKLWASWSRKE